MAMQNIKKVSKLEENIEYTEHMIKKTEERIAKNPNSFPLQLKKFSFEMRLKVLKNELKEISRVPKETPYG